MKLEHAGSPRLSEATRSSQNPNIFVEDQTNIALDLPKSIRSVNRPSANQSEREGTVSRTWQSRLFNKRIARRFSHWEDAEPFMVYDIRKWTAVLLASTLIFLCDIGRFTIHAWLLLVIIWFVKFYSEHTLFVESSGQIPTIGQYVFPHIAAYYIVLEADKMGFFKGWFILGLVLVMLRFFSRHQFAFYTSASSSNSSFRAYISGGLFSSTSFHFRSPGYRRLLQ